VGHRAHRREQRHDERADVERLQRHPLPAASLHLRLRHVHGHREVHRERPERDGAEQPEHGVEERQHQRHHRRHGHERRAQHQLAQREPHRAPAAQRHRVLPVEERRLRPTARQPLLVAREHRLRVHLVRSDQVDDDGNVGDVDEPERLEEAGEDVPGRGVAERRVPDAPDRHVEDGRDADAVQARPLHRHVLRRRRLHRVLDLDEQHGVGVREGDVPERLQEVPRLGRRGDASGADPDAEEGAVRRAVRRDLSGAEEEPDEGVGERHDGGDDGDERHPLQARALGQDDLREAEQHHVHRPGRAAGRVRPLVVVAVRAHH
ncbi:Os01g0878750, partial [Oryza sativa Japonica Group]